MMLVMNTAVTRNDWVGRVIDGRFPLLEWLGNTEQAGVFRTELKGPQPQRAVIRLVASEPQYAETQLSQWKQAAALSHPHLMRVFETGRAEVGGIGLLYLVTEFAEESLAQVIPQRPLSASEAREMLDPVLDALSYLHGQGLAHGGIKPSNVMVVSDKLKLPVDTVRRAGSIRVSPAQLRIHDAPELRSGTIAMTSDIWSMGVTLVEALTQHPPAWDTSTHADPAVPVELAEPFRAIARGSLRYDAARRMSLREIRSLLHPSPSLHEPANEIDLLAPPDLAASSPAYDEKPAARGRIAAIVGAVVVVLAIVVFALTRSHAPSSAPPAAHTAAPQAAPPQPSPSVPAAPAQPPKSGVSKGEIAERVMPDVSAGANRTIRGKVDVNVRVEVDASGAVENARFESHGPSRYFATRALEAARKWSFKPPERDGKAVPSAWLLRFQFRRSGPEASASQVSP
jgi:TonB family protein